MGENNVDSILKKYGYAGNADSADVATDNSETESAEAILEKHGFNKQPSANGVQRYDPRVNERELGFMERHATSMEADLGRGEEYEGEGLVSAVVPFYRTGSEMWSNRQLRKLSDVAKTGELNPSEDGGGVNGIRDKDGRIDFSFDSFAKMHKKMSSGSLLDKVSRPLSEAIDRNLTGIDDVVAEWEKTEGRKYDLIEAIENGTLGKEYSVDEWTPGGKDSIGVMVKNTKTGETTYIRDDMKRMTKDEARKRHLSEFAGGMIGDIVKTKDRAGKEIDGDTTAWYDPAYLGYIASNALGYAGEYVAGGIVAKGALSGTKLAGAYSRATQEGLKGAIKNGHKLAYLGKVSADIATPMIASAAKRYEHLKADDYRMDENGDVYLAREGLGDGKAMTQAVLGAAGEAYTEAVVGEVAGMMVKKALGGTAKAIYNKVPGVKKLFNLTSNSLGDGVKNAAKRAYVEIMKDYAKIKRSSYYSIVPSADEFIEEYIQGALDEVVGLDTLDSADNKGLGEFTRDFFDWDANGKDLFFGIVGQSILMGGASRVMRRAHDFKNSVDSKVIGTLKLNGYTNADIAKMGTAVRLRMANDLSDGKATKDMGYSIADFARFSGVNENEIEKFEKDVATLSDKEAVAKLSDEQKRNLLKDILQFEAVVMHGASMYELGVDGEAKVLEHLGNRVRKFTMMLEERQGLGNSRSNAGTKANDFTSRIDWNGTTDSAGNINWQTDEEGRQYIESAPIGDSGLGVRIIREGDKFRVVHPQGANQKGYLVNDLGEAHDFAASLDQFAQKKNRDREIMAEYVNFNANRLVPQQTDKKTDKKIGAPVVTANNAQDALEKLDWLTEADKRELQNGMLNGTEGGAFKTQDGTILVFLDNLQDTNDALLTLAHEIGGHAAIAEGAKEKNLSLEDTIAEVYKESKTKDAKEAQSEYRIRRTEGEGKEKARAVAQEEGMVYGNEYRMPTASPLQKAKTAVKLWMKKRGMDVKLTDEDYIAIAAAGLKRIEQTRTGDTGTDTVDDNGITVTPTAQGAELKSKYLNSKWIGDYYAQREKMDAARAEMDAKAAEKMHAEQDEAERAAEDAKAATEYGRPFVAEALNGWFGNKKTDAAKIQRIVEKATDEEIAELMDYIDLEMDGKASEDTVLEVAESINRAIVKRTVSEAQAKQRAEFAKRSHKQKMERDTKEGKLIDKFVEFVQFNPQSMLAFWMENGRKLLKQPITIQKTENGRGNKLAGTSIEFISSDGVDAEALTHFFDGMRSDERAKWMRIIFGEDYTNANRSGTSGRMDTGADEINDSWIKFKSGAETNEEVMADDDFNNIGAMLRRLREEYEEYEQWKSGDQLTAEEKRIKEEIDAENAAMDAENAEIADAQEAWGDAVGVAADGKPIANPAEIKVGDAIDVGGGLRLGVVERNGDVLKCDADDGFGTTMSFKWNKEKGEWEYVEKGNAAQSGGQEGDSGTGDGLAEWQDADGDARTAGGKDSGDGERPEAPSADAAYDEKVVAENTRIANADMGGGNRVSVKISDARDEDGNSVAEEYYLDGKKTPVYSMGSASFFIEYLGKETNNEELEKAFADFIEKRYGTRPSKSLNHKMASFDEAGPEFRNFKDALDFANTPIVKDIINKHKKAPSADAEEKLTLTSATAAELAAEEKRNAERAEVKRRANAPLKTGKGEIGQTLMDLGGAEGEDLFNRTGKWRRQNGVSEETHRKLGKDFDALLSISQSKDSPQGKWRRAKEAGLDRGTMDDYLAKVRDNAAKDAAGKAQGKWRRVGTRKDGVPQYETDSFFRHLTMQEKRQWFKDTISYTMRNRDIRIGNGTDAVSARIERDDQKKLVGSMKGSSERGAFAKSNLFGERDIEDILAGLLFIGEGVERGKYAVPHRNVSKWAHYRGKIEVDGEDFYATAALRNVNGEWKLYDIELNEKPLKISSGPIASTESRGGPVPKSTSKALSDSAVPAEGGNSVSVDAGSASSDRTDIPETSASRSSATASPVGRGENAGIANKDIIPKSSEGEQGGRWRRNSVTPEMDAAYADAVKHGDRETALRMIREAAAKAMPNTKVVGEDGLPLVVYHGTKWKFTKFIPESHFGGNIEQALDRIGFYHDQSDWDEVSINELEARAKDNGKTIVRAFINLENPVEVSEDFGSWYAEDFKKRGISLEGKDGVIYDNWHEGIDDVVNPAYIVFNPSQIKSADITYDDAGNLIPLSERFNSDNNDIRWRRSYTPNPIAQRLADIRALSSFRNGTDHMTEADRLRLSRLSNNILMETEKMMRELAQQGSISPELRDLLTKTQTGSIADRTKGNISAMFSSNNLSRIRELLQDAQISLKEMEKRYGVKMDDSSYHQFDRNFGMVAYAMKELERDIIEPLGKEMRENNLGVADLNMYLLALHGAERNRMIAERSPYVLTALADKRTAPMVQGILNGTNGKTELNDKDIKNVATLLGWVDKSGNLTDEAHQFLKDLMGSGATTAWWNEKLADFRRSGFDTKATEAVKLVRKLTQMNRDILVKTGRLSAKQAAMWEKLSPNYVPMKSDMDMDVGVWNKWLLGGGKDDVHSGKKYSNEEYKHAYGRGTIADDPVSFAIQQYEESLARAWDNVARRKLADMVRANQNMGKVFRYENLTPTKRAHYAKAIAIINAKIAAGKATADEIKKRDWYQEAFNASGSIPTTKVLGANGIMHTVPTLVAIEGSGKNSTNIIAFKEDGELKFIRLGGFKQDAVNADPNLLSDVDAKRIAASVKKHNMAQLNGLMRKIRGLTGMFSALRTAFSPTFVLSNFGADNTQAARNIYATFGAKAVATFEKFAFHSFGAAQSVLNGNYGNTKIQQYAKEWAENGSMIGGLATESIKDLRKDVDSTMRRLASQADQLKNIHDIKSFWTWAKDKGSDLAKFSEHWNSVVEMSTRIAAYATAREMGKSIDEAVSYSRDITVNFNRKGTETPWINALYAFSNATMQDIHRSLVAFAEGNTGSGVRILAGRGAKMGLGLVVLGFISSMFGYWQDDEDDEKEGKPQWKYAKEYQKQNVLGVRIGNKTVGVPIRGVSRIPYYLGHQIYEAFTGRKSAARLAADTVSLALENATDFLGTNPDVGQIITPSVIRPYFEIRNNQTFTGSPMYREPLPGQEEVAVRSEMGRNNTSDFAKWAARALNSLTGGSKYKRGAIDVQPEKIVAVWNWLFGTAGRDMADITGTAVDVVTGNIGNRSVRNIPYLSRFVRDLDENSADYYEARNRYNAALQAFNGMSGDEELDEDTRMLVDENPWLSQHGDGKRWGKELKDLEGAVQKLMKAERAASKDEYDAVHQMRLKAQYQFMRRLETPPSEDEEGVAAEREHKHATAPLLRSFKREQKHEQHEKKLRKRLF